MLNTHSNRKPASVLLAAIFFAVIAFSGCAAENAAPATPVFEKLASAISDHYANENSYAAAMGQLGIDSEQVKYLEGVDDLPREAVDPPVSIDGREYQMYVDIYEGRLTYVRLLAELQNDADVLPVLQGLFTEMEALYGEPSTYPELPNLLSEYLEGDEQAVPLRKEPFSYSDTWTVVGDIKGEAGMNLLAGLSLLGGFSDGGDQPDYRVEIVYAIRGTR